MSRRQENTGFTCSHCRCEVLPLNNGGYRNHCPYCLYSKHVDIKPGDRKSPCGGLMKPIRIQYKSGKQIQIIHRCLRCGIEKVNKIAEDAVQPDDIDEIIRLSM
ncbi:MAG: RNHCP domain-containing protein [Dehalococcoidia bacterium]|jgi:hypothetical protein